MTRDVRHELKAPEDVTLDLGLSASVTGVGIDVGFPVPVGRLWGWILRQIPGRRYTKLLMRMHLAAHVYRRLDRHLLTLWSQV